MTEDQQYKCVNCGGSAKALFKTYGPSVLKLSNCIKCKGIVDKYVEYDPVIVMIDIVLISKEAQRHVIFNTEFKSYWKLFIILIMLETYGLWRSDSLFTITVNSICEIKSNNTINIAHLNMPMPLSLPASWQTICKGWDQGHKPDDTDLFIWEKDFYVQFISTLSGVMMFIIAANSLMKLFNKCSVQQEVSSEKAVKAFALANMSLLFTLPTLVWGSETTAETKMVHYSLVFVYSFVVFTNVFTVLYECQIMVTIAILLVSNGLKYYTTFIATPYIREVFL